MQRWEDITKSYGVMQMSRCMVLLQPNAIAQMKIPQSVPFYERKVRMEDKILRLNRSTWPLDCGLYAYLKDFQRKNTNIGNGVEGTAKIETSKKMEGRIT